MSKERLRLVTAFQVTATVGWPADVVVSPRDLAVYSTYQSVLLSARYVSALLARLNFRHLSRAQSSSSSSLKYRSLKLALLVRVRLVCADFATRLMSFLWNGVVGVGYREMDRALGSDEATSSLNAVVEHHARFVSRLEQLNLWESGTAVGKRFTRQVKADFSHHRLKI